MLEVCVGTFQMVTAAFVHMGVRLGNGNVLKTLKEI